MPEHIWLIINSLTRANLPGFSLGGNTYSRNKISLSAGYPFPYQALFFLIDSHILIKDILDLLVFGRLFQDLFDFPELIR